MPSSSNPERYDYDFSSDEELEPVDSGFISFPSTLHELQKDPARQHRLDIIREALSRILRDDIATAAINDIDGTLEGVRMRQVNELLERIETLLKTIDELGVPFLQALADILQKFDHKLRVYP